MTSSLTSLHKVSSTTTDLAAYELVCSMSILLAPLEWSRCLNSVDTPKSTYILNNFEGFGKKNPDTMSLDLHIILGHVKVYFFAPSALNIQV